MDSATPAYVLAFDTANEVIALGVGRLDAAARAIELVASTEVEARRASNTQLVPRIDELCAQADVAREEIACVCVGRGPGSFTGVRIALATAKGVASALEVGLVGVSSLDAVAWGAWRAGERGSLLVVADAMRREVYPVEYRLGEDGAERLTADRVIKAGAFAEELGAMGSSDRLIAGDGLRKYADLIEGASAPLPEALWTPTGAGLLLALQAAWRAVREKSAALKQNEACAVCKLRPLCRACPASSLREGGAFGTVPPYVCAYTKALYRLLCAESTASEILKKGETVPHAQAL